MKPSKYLVCGLTVSLLLAMACPMAWASTGSEDALSAMLLEPDDQTISDAAAQKQQLKEEKKKARNHEKFEKRQAKKKAKQSKRQAKAIAHAQKEADKVAKKLANLQPQTVYLFGAGINFLDSVVYVTDFQSLDSLYIEPEGDLREHYAYTADLKFYLESTLGIENETCAVFYMTDEKKATKRYTKMDAKLRKKGFVINRVSRNDFAFTRQDPEPEPQP